MKVWLSRNAKRLAALTLTLVLVLALAACGAQADEPAATATPAVETPAVATPAAATPTPAATAQPGQSGAATGAQALTDVLADIAKNVQVGVAGSSLKAVPYAVKLLDWGTASTMTRSEIKTAVAN